MLSAIKLHSFLAVLSTLGALAAWQLPETTTVGEQVLIQGELKRVEWQEEQWQVALYKKDNEELWVEIEKQDEIDQNTKRKHYAASKQARNLFAGLSTLKVNRTLGVMDDLSEFGLGESRERVQLQYAHKAVMFDIGGGTYGKAQTYVRDRYDVVHLLASNRLAGLRHGATGLIERKAFNFDLGDVERVVIKRLEGARKLVVRKEATGNNVFLSDPAEPDRKLEQSSAWLGRLLRLRIVDVDVDTPRAKPVFRVELELHSGKKEKVSIWQPDERVAFMSTERYEKTLMISKHEAQSLIDDINLVLNEGR